MTLVNLLAIQRLLAFSATPQGVQRLLAAAARNLADAHIPQLSPENRFDAAYKCILQCAMLGLWARGYRTSTSQPGHHQTALQALPLTMGLPNDIIIVLDALRKQRNLNDYEGDPVSDGVVAECLTQAQTLLAHTQRFLQTQFPDLLVNPKK
ncbi:MAG: DNA-binding protein [Rhodoferax sp.]